MVKHAIIGVAMAAALTAHAASADAQSQNKPAAEAAFRKGKELIAAGKVADACASFEHSQKLDAQLGTQYNLALCYQRLGKLASAWVVFSELAQRDTNAGRKADSAKRARSLEPRLTKMILRVAEPVPGLVITQDGADVTLLVGTESPVDAGGYQFEARAPGRRPWIQPVNIQGEGQTVTVEVPVLDVDPATVPSKEPPEGEERRLPPPPDDDEEPVDGSSGSTRRWIGLGVGGAGVVVLGLGAVFGVQAMGLKSEADDACGGSTKECPPDKVDEADKKIEDARGKATLSTVGVGVGVVAVAAGVFLYLTAPSGSAESATALTPVIGGDQVGFALSGRF